MRNIPLTNCIAQVKMLDGERNKLDKEVTELQTRVAKDEEKEEEARKTSFDLKQKVGEYIIFMYVVLIFIFCDVFFLIFKA